MGMNDSSKNMDFLTKHWAPYPRRYPGRFPLASSDFIDRKTTRVENRFNTCNFSLILRGEGHFEKNGKVWPVQAPCVITQWPGEMTNYGPEPGSWTEWYLVYHRGAFKRFHDSGLIDLNKPVWPIADPVALHLHLSEFSALARAADPAWVVDRVDRLAEQAILDTWLAPNAPWKTVDGISIIAASLREGLSTPWNFDEMALKTVTPPQPFAAAGSKPLVCRPQRISDSSAWPSPADCLLKPLSASKKLRPSPGLRTNFISHAGSIWKSANRRETTAKPIG